MLSTQSINQLSTTRPDLYAFRIEGEVSREDMTEMAEHMNSVFDAHDQVDMLLYFDDFKGSEAGASMSLENIQSRLRALSSVRRYVVANAPDAAGDMVETLGKVLPVQAESYETVDEAFDALGAKAMLTAS